jgi:hypothetical protein
MAAPSLLGTAERGKEGRVCGKERKAGTDYTYGSMAAVSLIDTLPYGGGTLPGAVKAAAMPNGIAARAATSFLTFMSWASGVVLWWEAVEKGKEWLRVNGWWRD